MADQNDIREEFSPLLDNELSPDARDELERELAQDAELLRELDALRKVDELYRGLPRASAPDDMAERVRTRVQGESNVTGFRPRRVPVALYSGLAAAAMFMVVIGGLVMRDEFIVSPSASERADVAVQEAESVETDAMQAEAEPSQPLETAAAFGDDATPRDEDVAPLRQQMRAAGLEEVERSVAGRAAEAPLPELRKASTMADAPETVGESQEAAAFAGQAESPAPPPPAPVAAAPMPAEALADDRADVQADTEGAALSSAARVQADAKEERERRVAVKEAAGRTFTEREDGWYERGYDGEATRIVRRGSDALAAIAPRIEGLAELLALEGDIVFRLGQRWYRVPAAESDE